MLTYVKKTHPYGYREKTHKDWTSPGAAKGRSMSKDCLPACCSGRAQRTRTLESNKQVLAGQVGGRSNTGYLAE